MKNILVVGGAGYIGSHAVVDLLDNGYNPIVLDNLSEGHREAVKGELFEQVDLADKVAINELFAKYNIEAVMHFAAFTYVGESQEDPKKYYRNNVVNTINLLDVMLENNVKNIIFSSTCATYGDPQYMPLDENHPQNPINTYGRTKLMIEQILKDYSRAYGLKYMALRYFNAAGASAKYNIGESHRIETHLIPLVLKTLTEERKDIKVFGDDYDTPDGTCIRDYIHVDDLASAHRLALNGLNGAVINGHINLGTGSGSSVLDVIKSCERVTGLKVPYEIMNRRDGDPAILVAANEYAYKVLGWKPKFTLLDDIVATAWKWEQNKLY